MLNGYPHSDSLQLLPVRKRDSLSNVEQVTLDNPGAGNYTIEVKGFNVSSEQNFVLAYQFDSTDIFIGIIPQRMITFFLVANHCDGSPALLLQRATL